MAKRGWKIALGVGCGVVAAVLLLIVVGIALLVGGASVLEEQMAERGSEPLSAVEIRECELVRNGDSVTARGSVRNGGQGPVSAVKVSLRWQDGTGSVLAQEETYAGEASRLEPGASSAFEHVRNDPAGTVVGVGCRIACVKTTEAILCSSP